VCPSSLQGKALSLYQQGITDRWNGKFEAAIESFTEAITEVPGDADLRNARGVVFLRVAKYAEAIADFEEAIRLKPSMPHFKLNLGLALAMKQHAEAAVSALTDFLEASGDEISEANLFAHYRRALCFTDLKRPKKAEHDFKRVMELGNQLLNESRDLVSPMMAVANHQLGLLCMGEGDYKRARAYIEASIRLDPLNPSCSTVYFDLGCVHQQLADQDQATSAEYLQKALANFNVAIDRDPKHVLSYLGKAQVLVSFRQLNEALEAIAKAKGLDPKSWLALYLEGCIYLDFASKETVGSGEGGESLKTEKGTRPQTHTSDLLRKAIGAFTAAIACDSSCSEGWKACAEAWELLGDQQHAQENKSMAESLENKGPFSAIRQRRN